MVFHQRKREWRLFTKPNNTYTHSHTLSCRRDDAYLFVAVVCWCFTGASGNYRLRTGKVSVSTPTQTHNSQPGAKKNLHVMCGEGSMVQCTVWKKSKHAHGPEKLTNWSRKTHHRPPKKRIVVPFWGNPPECMCASLSLSRSARGNHTRTTTFKYTHIHTYSFASPLFFFSHLFCLFLPPEKDSCRQVRVTVVCTTLGAIATGPGICTWQDALREGVGSSSSSGFCSEHNKNTCRH